MFEKLKEKGFDIAIRNHAQAILKADFPEISKELIDVLMKVKIPADDLIGSGGGETPFTQRLRMRLHEIGWEKHKFNFKLIVDEEEKISSSHEIDHIRQSGKGTIALEIEWNNKDPFFDRDLENFQRLHAQSVISVGIIITRGTSLQDGMFDIIQGCIERHGFIDEEEIVEHLHMKSRTKRQRDKLQELLGDQIPFAKAFSRQFVQDKFGKATTHWEKLKERIDRGVGSPCPLLLIGLPDSIVV